MASTQITGRQIADGSIERSDINISAAGKALIRKLIVTPSTGITISSYTGADSGTGDVTLAIDTNTIATRAWVQAQGYLTSDSYVSNVQLLGNSLEFTGVGNGFGGSVDLSTIIPTESDTLATVTSRGASTSTSVTFNGNVTLGNNADLIFQDLAGVFPTTGKGFDWTLNNDGARIYAIQPSSDTIDFVFQLRDNATTNDRFVFWVQEWRGAAYDKYPLIIRGGTEFDLVDSGLFIRGTQVITNGRNLQNVSGNISMFTNDSGYITVAALNGYATQTYVNTNIQSGLDSLAAVAHSGAYADLSGTPAYALTATQWTVNHTLADGTRYLINDVVYDNGNIYKALFENESIPTSNTTYWQLVGPGSRINLDGRDIPNIQFTQLSSVPTTIAGYGITNAYTDAQIENFFNGANAITGYNKSNWDTAYSWGNHATAGYQPASTAINTSNIGSQSVNYANSAGSSTTTLRGIVEDTRGGQRTPTDYDDYRVSWEFTNQIPGLNSGGSTWWSAMTIQGWHDGYAAWQIIGPASSAVEDFYLRSGNNASWNTSRRIWHNGDFTSTNVSNWNTAYSWGNHASIGYATQAYVNTAVSNLVDSAPETLDTLNELAAALGDDPNFATTVTNNIATKLPLAGGTMSGKIFTLSSGADAYGGAIEIRERAYVSNTQSDWSYSPAISFHWGNRHVQRFGLRADGLFAVDDSPIALRSWVTAQGYLTSLPSHNHDSLYVKLDGTSVVQNTLNINSTEMGGTARSWMNRGVVIGGGGSDGAYFGMKVISVNNAQTVIAWGDDSGDDLHFINTLSGGPVDGVTYMTFFGSQNTIRMYKQLDVQSTIYSQEGNSSQWSTAYSWGNHASQGYATQSWVQSQGYITSLSDVWVNTSGDTMTGSLRFNEGSGFGRVAYLDNYHGMILRGIPSDAAGNVTVGDYTSLIQHSGDFRFYRTNGSINELYFQVNASAAYWRGNTIWHSGNDGAGSGLDADLLDGFERSASGGGDRIAQYASNGYLYVNNWIHPANGTGLFYDSGPHFYESGGQMYSSHALRVNANILITDGTDNNRFTKGSNFLNLRDPWNNLHMQINSGGGMYFDAGHFYLRRPDGGTNWLYLDGSNYNVYIEQHNYARVTFRYNTDRYAQSWYNSTTGAYWWVTTDAGQLGLHRNGDGDKFYFSNGGDFYSTTNGWLSTALAGKSNTGHTHDDRYYTESESDSRFVNVAGDSMTGTLYAPRVLLGSGTADNYIGDGGIRIGRTDTDYTQGTSWSGTRSTMFIDCQDVATITIHDSAHRLVEYMTYSGGGTNIIYSGRDIGWGTTNWYFGADITVNGTITENSSIRYKENVKSLEYSSEAFAKLKPVRYNKKGSGIEEIGLIAEDVAALYPEVVKYDKDGNPDGVNYTRLSAILIKAVQELTDKVNQLEKNA